MAQVSLVPSADSLGPSLAVQRFVISASSSGDNTIVAAPGPGLRIVLLNFMLVASGAVAAKWRSNSTDLTGAMPVAGSGSGIAAQSPAIGLVECAANQALKLNLSDAVQVGGFGSYVVESA